MNTSENINQLIITQTDKKILEEINLKRDMIKDGIVWEGVTVSIRVWIPENYPEGVIDLCIPVSEDNTFGFKDKWEAIVRKDAIGVYRLSERGRSKDIPIDLYQSIEENILLPVSMGAIVPLMNMFSEKELYTKSQI